MDRVKLYWWNDVENAGDFYSKWLLDRITSSNIEHSTEPDIICSGSILASKKLMQHTKVWGAGFNNTYSEQVIDNKDNYFAVRGKLTLDKLDIDKDIVLGDPGLLLSMFVDIEDKIYDVGFVLHYIDIEYAETLSKWGYVISMNTTDIDKVAHEIGKCKFIYSSSLHGVIFAHSLGIPAKHLEINPLSSKNNFKFKDYYTVLNIPYTKEVFTDDLLFIEGDRTNCKPDADVVSKIQKDLMDVFPYPKKRRLK